MILKRNNFIINKNLEGYMKQRIGKNVIFGNYFCHFSKSISIVETLYNFLLNTIWIKEIVVSSENL
jgi:hypothetical protein